MNQHTHKHPRFVALAAAFAFAVTALQTATFESAAASVGFRPHLREWVAQADSFVVPNVPTFPPADLHASAPVVFEATPGQDLTGFVAAADEAFSALAAF